MSQVVGWRDTHATPPIRLAALDLDAVVVVGARHGLPHGVVALVHLVAGAADPVGGDEYLPPPRPPHRVRPGPLDPVIEVAGHVVVVQADGAPPADPHLRDVVGLP